MSIYIVSFRIADQISNFGAYSDRWSSVNGAIQALAEGRNYWQETTSFFSLESSFENSSQLANAINMNSNFDPGMDLLLVINLSRKGYTVLGDNGDADIDAIMSLR
jgi:hypothetical protein